MARFDKYDLTYLDRKPKRVFWQVIAGLELSPIQRSDLVFDEHDYAIRQL